MDSRTEYIIAGDKCILIRFGNTISSKINMMVRKYHYSINTMKVNGIIECVPAYSSLSVFYDPLIITYSDLLKQLISIGKHLDKIEIQQPSIYEIPVCYAPEYGIDLQILSQYLDISVEEIIRIHSGREYLVYMLGFTPGFCFLGEISEKIAVPRLDEPRTRVPAGSVGIAGNQTGIYSIDSPGGWRLLGRTPIELFTPLKTEKPVLLSAGDTVRFIPVTKSEYDLIQNDINQKRYKVIHYMKENKRLWYKG